MFQTRAAVEPWLHWFKPGQRCTNAKPGQPLLKQGSEAIKPPFDDNVRFRPDAGSTQTISRGHLRFGGLAVVQSAKI